MPIHQRQLIECPICGVHQYQTLQFDAPLDHNFFVHCNSDYPCVKQNNNLLVRRQGCDAIFPVRARVHFTTETVKADMTKLFKDE